MDDLISRLRELINALGPKMTAAQNETISDSLEALEAAREAAAYMRNQVKWEPCDCGCPAARTPKDARAVTWLRAAAMVNRAISGRRDE